MRHPRLIFRLMPPLGLVLALAWSAPIQRAQAQFGPRFWPRMFVPRGGAVIPPATEETTETENARAVVLPENGELRRRLDQVRGELEAERYADAVRELGKFLQDPQIQDFFLARDEERQGGVSFLAEVRRLIQSLPTEGRAIYQLQFEAVARQKLAEAHVRGGESNLREVVRRYYGTRAADEALFRLGQFLWDHGRPRAAALCLERARAVPESAEPFEPRLSLLAAASWRRAGEPDRAAEVLRQLSATHREAVVQIAGRPEPLLLGNADQSARRLAVLVGDDKPATDPSAAWTIHRGDAARNKSVPAGPPFLAPRWSHEVAIDSCTQRALERGLKSQQEGTDTFLPMLVPIVTGDLVLMRTSHGAAAFDLTTGQRRWQNPTDDGPDNSGVDSLMWHEPAGGVLVADAERFYLLDDVEISGDDATNPSTNTLTARDYAHLREGNLCWQVGGATGGGELKLAGAFFLGPPVPWHGRLYVLAEARQALWLMVLDAATGKLEWSQELAAVEQAINIDRFRARVGSSPSISDDEIAVCPTSGGAVAAVDLTTQSLLWAYRYPRTVPKQADASPDNPYQAAVPRLDQAGRWLDAAATLAGGRVFLTPPESGDLHCLNLHDGQLLWTHPRDDGLYVACVADERIVVMGEHRVAAFRTSDGTPAWEPISLAEGVFPAGRGLFAGRHYYLPVTSAAIVRFDLAEGRQDEEYKSPREIVPGNLAWHRGLVVSLGATRLEAFDELEPLADEVRRALELNPRDSRALVRQGELELASGRIDASITAFRQAWVSVPGAKTKAHLVSALLEGVRAGLPNQKELSDELDQLAAP